MSLIRHSVRVCFELSGHSQDSLIHFIISLIFYFLNSRTRVHTRTHVRARAFSIAGFGDFTDRKIRQREMVLSAEITESKHSRINLVADTSMYQGTCVSQSAHAPFILILQIFSF